MNRLAGAVLAPLLALGPLSDTLGELAYADAGSIHNTPPTPIQN